MAHPEFIQLMSASGSSSLSSLYRLYPVWMSSLAARVNLGFTSYRHMRRIQESKSRNDGEVSITPNAQNVTIGSQITLRFLPHQLTIPLFTP